MDVLVGVLEDVVEEARGGIINGLEGVIWRGCWE
jgi:hypothetical protein